MPETAKDSANVDQYTIEIHPLAPFLPEKARMLMLGSFPPPRARWSMEFYYPNMQNDMWRIFGLVFFGDKDHFLTDDPFAKGKARQIFSKPLLEEFLRGAGIALSDTARRVIRHKGNASDKFLEIVEPTDICSLLKAIPLCTSIVTTGDKATQTLAAITGVEPKTGQYCQAEIVSASGSRSIRHYRMPSSSRAYPMRLEEKAAIYEKMFRETRFLG